MRSVRLRLTAVAVLVTLVVAGALGAWVVRSVEGTLSAQSAAERDRAITAVQLSIDSGQPITDEALRAMAGRSDSGPLIELLDETGMVATSSAGAVDPGDVEGDGEISMAPAPDAAGEYAESSAPVATGNGNLVIRAVTPLEPMRQSVAATRRQLLWALPVLVLLVGALTWWLAGRALRPVERIRREVNEISGTTLERRVPVPASGDEVSALAVTMNSMLDRLQQSSDRQRQFIADASHELRSPVSAIRTELEVARMTAGPQDWPAVADQVLAEEQRLERVIADLLALARLDDGQPLATDAVDLAELVAAVVEPEVQRSAEGPVRVTLAAEDALAVEGEVAVDGAVAPLERLVVNLVENARRHAASQVIVSVRAERGGVVLAVDDDGPGIPEADRERIFDRFTRLDEHRSRGDGSATDGAGLGLSLVRRIAELHGSEVAVGDSPLGGARFTVRFNEPAR